MRALNDTDREEFLHLHKQLILFTNQKYRVYDKFKNPDNVNVSNLSQEDIQKGIFPLREKMYGTEHITDFSRQNMLTDEQKIIARLWSDAYEEDFYIVKHLKDYTVLLTGNEKKLYGVVGISGGLDDFFPEPALPALIKTTLLPFKQKIIYDGFFSYRNVFFGGNITRQIKQVYSELKGEQGIIIEPAENIPIGDLEPNKPDEEAIKFFVKQELKKNRFPAKAWGLAKKNSENRLLFETEYARYFAKYQIDALKNHDEIKSMYYAAYRSCIIGVADNKKSLMIFCKQHYPGISHYVYIFKA